MSAETYEFTEAAPVKRPGRQGAGRKREDNPFEAAVKSIAGQSDGEGNPLARSTKFAPNAEQGETLKQRKARIRRLLTRAGKDLVADGAEPLKITLVTTDTPDEDGNYIATFWHKQD